MRIQTRRVRYELHRLVWQLGSPPTADKWKSICGTGRILGMNGNASSVFVIVTTTQSTVIGPCQ